jgi:16S rRNA (adenine1518-N6/adenine1519-N6)-dimethyltransferase
MIEDLLLETKGQLRANKIKPGIVAGQNFLVSAAVLQDIVRAADIQSTEAVLEIGPGLGVLTKELAVRARQVLAIEYDRNLLPVLEKIKANHSNFTFINDDILRVKNQLIADCLGGDYRVIANIPYQITAKIINKFLTFSPRPKDLLLLVQKEVAERIVAGAGQLSKLAVSVQFYARPKIVRLVSRDCFWPAPAVDSALLKIVLDNKYSDILTKGD